MPLGTDRGVFFQDGDAVVARVDLLQSMEFVFNGEEAASRVLDYLHASLESEELVCTHLRKCFSLENMLAFIGRFIPGNEVIAVRWLARIRITTNGLEFQMPDGQWDEIHVENVSNTYNWKAKEDRWTGRSSDIQRLKRGMKSMKPGARGAYAHFGLTSDSDWEGVGRVCRPDGLKLWFLLD